MLAPKKLFPKSKKAINQFREDIHETRKIFCRGDSTGIARRPD
jgi:hypothetical protein